MKKAHIDARGLACPQPVALTKKALDENPGSEISVLVEGEIARDNVVRHAQNRGCLLAVEKKEKAFEIRIAAPAGTPRTASPAGVVRETGASGATVFLFDADFIGGNRELGKVLANGFLKAAASLDGMQGCVILISNAVRLAAEGSYALEVLSQLSGRGVRILICGTCVDFFGIRDKLRIGTVSNALEIMETMTQASKVIKF